MKLYVVDFEMLLKHSDTYVVVDEVLDVGDRPVYVSQKHHFSTSQYPEDVTNIFNSSQLCHWIESRRAQYGIRIC